MTMPVTVPWRRRNRSRIESGQSGATATATLALLFGIATVGLAWFGLVATREWNRSTESLLERRQTEALVLVSAALDRDMQGAFSALVLPITERRLDEAPPFDLQQDVARVFARFPYPDAFMTWRRRRGDENGRTYAFVRTGRPPRWMSTPVDGGPFPVAIIENPSAVARLIPLLEKTTTPSWPLGSVTVDLNGSVYHVVARMLFDSEPPYRPSGLAAITIDDAWVRQNYFRPLLTEVAHMGGNKDALSFTVSDDKGGTVVGNAVPPAAHGGFSRSFPLSFIEPALVRPQPEPPLWAVHVSPSVDSTLLAARRGSRQTFGLLVVMTIITCAALILTARAVQVRVSLAAMKADFVAAVTHELKTPLSLIGLVGDTLRDGRYASADTVKQYATVLSRESRRLSNSIDNLLTYARYAEGRPPAATFRPTRLGELVEDALERFRPSLEERQFALSVDVPESLPTVMADPPSLLHAIENIVDNSIKYSDQTRALSISTQVSQRELHIVVKDEGIGIPDDDLFRVFNGFFRARNATGRGSGLGLAIATRIVNGHGGRIHMDSVVGKGTTTHVVLPLGESR